jgi:general stress protein CsbA
MHTKHLNRWVAVILALSFALNNAARAATETGWIFWIGCAGALMGIWVAGALVTEGIQKWRIVRQWERDTGEKLPEDWV